MNTTLIKIDTRPIVLSRGIFFVKKSPKKRKLSKYNEDKLELRYARQLLHKELPMDVVTERGSELVSENELIYKSVAPENAKRKK
ncbi:hypothetical protein HDF26_001975 [Pedobacter cryoconitis]|uniref:hypothetical protein n=1 Tax=Pedobacter cryoconitis TaxID=188932 RepID=UPI001608A1E7|nr:hypothetical protein [Pedobacter cryoconitis]MBB6271548.1 hypothetical protein [Pedobacter cryoconitis]